MQNSTLPLTIQQHASALFQAVNLECVRGDLVLFSELCLNLKNGDILQIEGTNGSGKTSLLRILCGLTLPEQGEVLWCDKHIYSDRITFNTDLLYLGHVSALKGEWSAAQNLAASRSLMPSFTDFGINEALEHVGLTGFEDIPCRFLSAGQKRRARLARLLLTHAPLWILDEPVSAIDPEGIEMFEHLINKHVSRGGLVILTSHQTLKFSSGQFNQLSLTNFPPTMP